jgi:hypothetical protein
MKTRAWLSGVALAAVAALALGVEGARQDPFPHHEHARLFPLCTGCHEGVPQGNRAEFYPAPTLCAACHDGVELARVVWPGPTPPPPTNLVFSHPVHRTQAAERGDVVDCTVCHTRVGAGRMEVERTLPERCFACHAHAARDHFVDADCGQCHVPLARTGFALARIEGLPVPEDHVRGDFLARAHGQLARAEPQRCSTCHTRQRCESCHVDPDAVPAIATIPAAPPTMQLPQFVAHYFSPPSHLEPDWLTRHGQPANADLRQCSTCHVREDCASCHTDLAPRAVQRLPSRRAVQAPGVLLARTAPASHAAPFFDREHAALAASSPASCTQCHSRRMCEECHNAPSRPRFHPPNFTARHASAAYGQRMECQSCHDRRVFCRDCHEQAGMGTVGRLGPGFHDAEPLWLLRHAQPARMGLESCTTCHAQRDCTQCHSQLGAFQISPHGPGFDARRAQRRNPQICFACHLSDPLGRTR